MAYGTICQDRKTERNGDREQRRTAKAARDGNRSEAAEPACGVEHAQEIPAPDPPYECHGCLPGPGHGGKWFADVERSERLTRKRPAVVEDEFTQLELPENIDVPYLPQQEHEQHGGRREREQEMDARSPVAIFAAILLDHLLIRPQPTIQIIR